MANIIDVAKEANVSVATVSYVLSKKKYVSDDLTERVYQAVGRLGYKPNTLARGLRNRRTKEIGVVLQNLKNIFFFQLLSGLEDKLRELGYGVIFFESNYDIEKEKEAISVLRNRWVDGIILYSCVSEEERKEHGAFLAEQTVEKDIPIVSIDRDFRENGIALVTSEYLNGSYTVTKHLISAGKKRIAHISGRKGWNVSELRIEGYRKAMRDAGLGDNIVIRQGTFRPIDGYELCGELLESGCGMDAVFAANDQMAIGCIRAIKEKGYAIPNDIAVAGFDNIFVASLVNPALTTMNVPRYAMGTDAAGLLIGLIENGKEMRDDDPPLHLFPTDLVIRQSSDVGAEDDWELLGW